MKNIGPKTTADLEKIGLNDLKKIKTMGWEKAALLIYNHYPKYANLNMLRALIGACQDRDWRNIKKDDLNRAKELLKIMKA
jgi:hypothetical protein